MKIVVHYCFSYLAKKLRNIWICLTNKHWNILQKIFLDRYYLWQIPELFNVFINKIQAKWYAPWDSIFKNFISFFKNKNVILDFIFVQFFHQKIWKYIKRILHSNDTLNGPWHNVFLIYETYISIFWPATIRHKNILFMDYNERYTSGIFYTYFLSKMI